MILYQRLIAHLPINAVQKTLIFSRFQKSMDDAGLYVKLSVRSRQLKVPQARFFDRSFLDLLPVLGAEIFRFQKV